jgi:hypothetical protein
LNKLSDDDLKKLLMWKGVLVTRVTKPDKKLVLWKKIMSDRKGGGDVENNPAWWTDDDKDELERLRSGPVAIGDTAIVRHEKQMMKEAELADEKMNQEHQRAAHLAKLAAIDAAGENVDESAPF